MALHHRPHIDDIRHAYAYDRSDVASSRSGQERRSSGSYHSYRTAPSDFSAASLKKAPIVHARALDMPPRYFDDKLFEASPAASVETYASTVSDEDADAQDEPPEYDVPEYHPPPSANNAIPATPSDFSELFPSRKRLTVRHDDTTLDGNMNLRIDTEALSNGRRCNVTLFHLRMHDLKNREFSLRRYCRDSGREVCHSGTKVRKPVVSNTRPGLQRSLTNALSSMRSRSDSKPPTLANLARHDSGYGSLHSVDFEAHERPRSADADTKAQAPAIPNVVRLEFSNYAQVEVKRSGVKANKRYEFSYWGIQYAWRRLVRKESGQKEVAYHLTKAGSDDVLAFVVPIALSTEQAREEASKGGWVPPCSMWIADEQILQSKDASDVVVSSALIALVDDSIRARFHSKSSNSLLIPLPKNGLGVEYVGPKRLINELFRRDSTSSQQSRPSSSSRPSTSGTAFTRTRAGAVKQATY